MQHHTTKHMECRADPTKSTIGAGKYTKGNWQSASLQEAVKETRHESAQADIVDDNIDNNNKTPKSHANQISTCAEEI